MALCMLARPSPRRALLIARLHHTSCEAMAFTRLALRPVEFSKSPLFPQAWISSGRQSTALCKHSWIAVSGGSIKQRCFCSSSGSQGNNTSNAAHSYEGQQVAGNYMAQQQQQTSGNFSQPNTSFGQCQQKPAYPYANDKANTTYQQQQPQQASPAPTSQQPNAAHTNPSPGASSPPRTSAAAEVIDKYLGPSTLKLEKRDDRSSLPPPPPPRRNYGPQGTQEKKSGKDLVAESAACAVIEKYLGPWPGFPPRDPKIDEYLDSLPENAACAAIDKYFGPYKPLFVFKKNEENANNPPPPSRPPRNRMMSRARNRAWNAPQQGASVDRPWTAPQQQSTSANAAAQGGQYSPNAGGSPSQGAVPASTSQAAPSQQGAATTSAHMQGGATTSTSPPGAHMQLPHGGASSQ